MRSNFLSRSLLLAVFVVCGLLALHFIPETEIAGFTLKQVDILSDLKTADNASDTDIIASTLDKLALPNDSCKPGVTCIQDFSAPDSSLFEQLYQSLSLTGERKVRIAVLGDSFIEGDILTSHLRENLQQRFGGNGVGYVSIDNVAAHFRKTTFQRCTGFEMHKIVDKHFDMHRCGLSGYYFLAENDGASFELGVPAKTDEQPHLEGVDQSDFFFATGPAELHISASVNGGPAQRFTVQSKPGLQQLSVSSKGMKRVKWVVESGYKDAVFYGATLENANTGISVDNFAVRSYSGLNLWQTEPALLRQIGALRNYDLIVLQYGLNIVSKGKTKYDAYEEQFQKTLAHLKKCFPNTAFLILSLGDRGRRLPSGEIETMPEVLSFIAAQENVAAHSQVGFWNIFYAMGGKNSMATFATSKPPMAGKDYTHINFLGGKFIADKLTDALMWGKELYEMKSKPNDLQ